MSQNAAGISIPVPVNQGGTDSTTAAGALTNLGALPLAGGTMTGNLILNADPTLALQAATKEYVDTIASGITIKESCLCGSTGPFTVVYNNGAAGVGATLTNADTMAAFSTDGVTPSVNDRVLIKDQSSNVQNGIYVVTDTGSGATNWVLTRATDYDSPSEITPGSLVIVTSGTVNATTSWIQTDTVTAVGTDPIVFDQFTAGVGANTALSNLIATAINQSFLPGGENSLSIGAQNKRWVTLFAENIETGQTATNALALKGYDTGGASYTPFITITANNPATCVLASAVTGTTQTPSDNSTKLATTAYADAAAAAAQSASANKALSNLASVAINTSLLPGSDNAIALGSATLRWTDTFTETIKTGTTNANTTILEAYNTGGSSYTAFITLTAGATPTCVLASAVTGTTQSALDNSTKLATTAYVDNATGGGAGANAHLSNLSAVAINTALLPGSDNSLAFGSASLRWTDAFIEDLKTGTTGTQTLKVSGYNTGAANYTDFITVTCASTATCALDGSITGVTQSAGNNSTKLATTAYADTAAGARANVALSNLSGVAVNASLVPGADGSIDLGSAADRWRNALVQTVQTGTTAAQTTLLQAYNTNTTSYTTFATLTANNPPTMALASAVTGVTQSASDNSTKLATTAYVDNQVTATGANKALSNLASVAINASLIPGSDGAIDLGSAADRWRNAIVQTVQTGTTAAQTTLLQAYDTNGAAYTTFATLTANNPPTMSLASAVTATTQASTDSSTKIATTAFVKTAVPALIYGYGIAFGR